jgi:hypothetical protein
MKDATHMRSQPLWTRCRALRSARPPAPPPHTAASLALAAPMSHMCSRGGWPAGLLVHMCRVSCVAFAAGDTQLVAGYDDGSARCFNWVTGECVSVRHPAKSKRKQSNTELTAVVAPGW